MIRSLRAAAPVGLIWGSLLLAGAYAVLSAGLLTSHGANWPDFTWYYVAGQMVAAGHGGQLYDFSLQQVFESRLTGIPRSHLLFLPYLNPPLLAVLVAPLTLLPFSQAYLLWVGLNVAAAAAALWAVSTQAGLRGSARIAACAVAITGYPAFVTFARGQVDGLVLLGVALSWVAWRRAREGASGLVLGLAFFKFHVVLGVPLFLLARRSVRAVLGMVAALAIGFIPLVVWLGPGVWLDYLRTLTPAASAGIHADVSHLAGVDFGLVGITDALRLPRSVGLAAGALLLVVYAGVVWRRRADARLDVPLGVVVGFLASPYQGVQDLILLSVPLIVLAAELSQRRAPQTGWLAVVAIYAAGLVAFPLPLLVPLLLLLATGYLFFAAGRQPLDEQVKDEQLHRRGRDRLVEKRRVDG